MNTYEAFAATILNAIRRPKAAAADRLKPRSQQKREDVDPQLIVQIEHEAALDERKKALAFDRGRSALARAFARPFAAANKTAAAKRGPESVAKAIMGALGPRKPLSPAAKAVLRAC